MATFSEVLQEFKSNERFQSLIILEKDSELQKLLAVWEADLITRIGNSDCPDDCPDKWKWLWDQVSVDDERLLVRTGILSLKQKTQQAKELKLVYPDGAIHKKAAKLLKNKASKYLSDAVNEADDPAKEEG